VCTQLSATAWLLFIMESTLDGRTLNEKVGCSDGYSMPIRFRSPKEQERNCRKVYAIDRSRGIRTSLSWTGSYAFISRY
jgi:hypothetical protein